MEMKQEKAERLVQIAKMYYEDNLTQSEIAKEIGVSRALICRLLNEAKKYGIVTIQIHSPEEDYSLLKNQIRNRFKIEDVYIVNTLLGQDISDDHISECFSDVLLNLLPTCSNIGCSWGKIIHEALESLSKKEITFQLSDTAKVFPLAGNMITTGYSIDAQKIVQTFSLCFNAVPNFLYAPAFLESPMELELYHKTENYKNIAQCWKNIDMAIIKIDNYPTSPDLGTAARYEVLLKEKHACGSFLAYYYNLQGEIIRSDFDYSIQIPIEYLASCKKVIGVCSSNVMPKSLLGAMNTGLFTHIIASQPLLEAVLDLKRI